MAIVEKATTVKDYYRNLKEDYNNKLEDTIKNLEVAEKTNVKTYNAVSYTHLTLPTICSV